MITLRDLNDIHDLTGWDVMVNNFSNSEGVSVRASEPVFQGRHYEDKFTDRDIDEKFRKLHIKHFIRVVLE